MHLNIGLIQIFTLIIQILTLILLLGLFNIYRKSYKQIKIGYTIGLLVFALLLIFKTIVELTLSIFILSTPPINVPIIEDRNFFPAIIQFIAVAVLYKITKDY